MQSDCPNSVKIAFTLSRFVAQTYTNTTEGNLYSWAQMHNQEQVERFHIPTISYLHRFLKFQTDGCFQSPKAQQQAQGYL
jgi:uncharacterized protein (UPF0254 family)